MRYSSDALRLLPGFCEGLTHLQPFLPPELVGQSHGLRPQAVTPFYGKRCHSRRRATGLTRSA